MRGVTIKRICTAAVAALLFLYISCADSDLPTPEAKPYEVVGSDDETTSNGRTARHWYIVSRSTNFEEHAQTLARAASDLHQQYGFDLTQVTLCPSKALAGIGVRYAHGFYAADNRAGQGLPGADPEYRATWSVLATRDVLSPSELRVAELWVKLAPQYPSTDMLSSCHVDKDALCRRISDELDMDLENVRLPHLRLERWIEIAE